MAIEKPSVDDLRRANAALGLELSDEELGAFEMLSEGLVGMLSRLDDLDEPAPAVMYPRGGGRRPSPHEDLLNAWYWKCSIAGAPDGKLAGRRVVVKDNVCVAGIPMSNGSAVLDGYVPDVDATVVTRVLDAGGEIAGKAVCESFCLSGGSHLADTGATHNPHRRGYSAGGSSSGSAALVASGEVDMSIGADQAGSIRVPSSWSGIVGLKPTFGLVPYTGACSLEYTIDHLGPMARNVRDAALLLEVLAGPDGLDARQAGASAGEYVRELAGGAHGLRVGLVGEGFGWPGASEPDVDALVEEAAHTLERAGAAVSRISVPLHRDGMSVFMGIGVEGTTRAIADGYGMGFGWRGFYTRSLMAACARGLAERSAALSPVTKLVLVLGRHLQATCAGQYYARAQNLAIALRRAYDDALRDVDLLVMPTTPMKARPLPPADAGVVERVARAMEGVANTSPFNVTGHPALSIPCGTSDGLPVGMMLVGRHDEDATVLRAGSAFEQLAR